MKPFNRRVLLASSAALLTGVSFLPNSAIAAITSLGKSQFSATANTVGLGTVAFDVAIRNISDNSSAPDVRWSGITLPSGYVRAATYLVLNSTITAAGGGIQIYTDNTATGASPHFAGTAAENPAGLLDTVNPRLSLPLAWSIKDAPTTLPPAADPNNSADTNSFQWFFVKDHSYTPNPILYPDRQFPYIDGEPYVTVRVGGLLNGVAGSPFFPATSPDYLYFEADFRTALSPRIYQTGTLTLEAYNQ